jgi:hypothetical protein
MEGIKFDNLALRTLPIDPVEENYTRSVSGACFSKVDLAFAQHWKPSMFHLGQTDACEESKSGCLFSRCSETDRHRRSRNKSIHLPTVTDLSRESDFTLLGWKATGSGIQWKCPVTRHGSCCTLLVASKHSLEREQTYNVYCRLLWSSVRLLQWSIRWWWVHWSPSLLFVNEWVPACF